MADPGEVLWGPLEKWVWFWLKVGVFQRKLMKRTPPCESSGSTPADPGGRGVKCGRVLGGINNEDIPLVI